MIPRSIAPYTGWCGSRSHPLPWPLLAAVTAISWLAPATDPTAILTGLALCAAIVAAIDRRTSAMLVATGIAIGLGAAGTILLPLALGLAIRERGLAGIPIAVLAGTATAFTTGAWTVPAAMPSLVAIALADHRLVALVAAAAVGFAGWTIATASCAHPAATSRLAGIALIGGAAFVPTAAVTLMLPLILVLRPGVAVRPLARAANDNRGEVRVRLAA